MRHALAFCLLIGLAPAAFAAVASVPERQDADSTQAPVYAQRQDVREISLPPLPTGPANPAPGCQPANPVC